MQLRTLLAPLAALLFLLSTALPARAQSIHTGHDPARKCTWQADILPRFVPGNSSVNVTGSTVRTSILFKSVVGRTKWEVVVFPGYHFGWVYAWDEGVPLESTCNQAYARSSMYSVLKSTDCCQPQRTAKPSMSCSFRVRAVQLNAPGMASAQGVTHIHAANTGLSCVATGAATTRSDDAGMPIGVQIPLPGGGNAKISFNLDFDSEECSTDSASNVMLGAAKAAPDEEYGIVTDLDLEATADGAPWDTAESAADLMQHTLWIRTELECKHCTQKFLHQRTVDSNSYGVTEKSCVDVD